MKRIYQRLEVRYFYSSEPGIIFTNSKLLLSSSLFRKYPLPDAIVQAIIPATQESEAGGSQVGGQTGQFSEIVFQNLKKKKKTADIASDRVPLG